jgi:hypothetical protein
MDEPQPQKQPVLDDTKRHDVITLLSVGCSRSTAARYVGCSPKTIRETARRDKAFATELRKADQVAEINYLRNIQAAAKQERYWRAAAWALERCHPEQYAPRRADSVPLDEVRELLDGLVQIICEEIAAAKRRKPIVRRFDALLRGFLISHERHELKDASKEPSRDDADT